MEEAPKEEAEKVHYLAHHPIFKQNSTNTKLRDVYDVNEKVSKYSPSLNECRCRGQVILPDLLGIQLVPIIMIANVKVAFLQVELHEKDCDVTRFFWTKDPEKSAKNNGNYTIFDESHLASFVHHFF